MTRRIIVFCALAMVGGCAGRSSTSPTSPTASDQTTQSPPPLVTLPSDGNYAYGLALHLISGSDCYEDGRATPQAAPFTDTTFSGTVVVSGGQLQFSIPVVGDLHAAIFVLSASGVGSLTGDAPPWAGVGPLMMTFDMAVSALSGQGLSGTLAGRYSDEGFPYNYVCNTSQIAFTLTPGSVALK
jgi:hypothetical protein